VTAALVAEAKQCVLMPQSTAALPDFRSSLCRHGVKLRNVHGEQMLAGLPLAVENDKTFCAAIKGG